jgi:hypothetical protein
MSPPSDKEYIENRTTDSIREILEILGISGEALFEAVPTGVIVVVSCVKEYLQRLTSDLQERFFIDLVQHLEKYAAPECYPVFAALFLLLRDHGGTYRTIELNFQFICGQTLLWTDTDRR